MLRNKYRILRSNLILSKEGNEPTPCFDIEYWRSYGPFHLSRAKYKILHRIAATFLIFNIIIFPLDGFQPHHPPFISTIHTVILKHCSLFFLLCQVSTIVVVTFFLNFWLILVQTWFQSCTLEYIYQFFSFFSCVWQTVKMTAAGWYGWNPY